MNNVLLSIKTDEETKRALKDFASELGVSSTAFVNLVIRQALRDRRIVISTSLEPTPYLQDIIKEPETDYRAGKNIVTTETDDETLDYLRSLWNGFYENRIS